MSGPNLHRLQIFQIVYEMQNISAASRKLGLAQPTLSRHLAVLEKELGFELFLNVGGRIEPTWEAQRLYEETAGLFERVAQVEKSVEAIRIGAQSSLRVITSSALALEVVPAAIGEIYQKMPELDLVLEGGGQRAQIEALRCNAADSAVGGVLENPTGLRQTVLGKFPVVAVMKADHPLAIHDCFDLASLEHHASIMQNPKAPIGAFIFAELARRGITPKRYISAYTLPFSVSLARHMDLCTVTDFFSAKALKDDTIVIKPLSDPLYLELVTLEPASAGRKRGVAEFKAALKRALQRQLRG
ncbi:MAG: LysR family transcriptional regulator [Thalassovita sp.]